MSRYVLVFLAVLGLSCNKDDDEILFIIPFPNLDFEIQAGMNPLDTWYFNIDQVPTNGLALLEANNIDTASIKSLVPNTAGLTSVFGDADFDFVYEIAVYLCEEGNHQAKCGKEIFYRYPLPNKPGNYVDLIPNLVEVKDLILREKVNVQIMLRFETSPQQLTESRLELDFAVK